MGKPKKVKLEDLERGPGNGSVIIPPNTEVDLGTYSWPLNIKRPEKFIPLPAISMNGQVNQVINAHNALVDVVNQLIDHIGDK